MSSGQLQVRCLGDFAVRREERSLNGFESRKVRALLVYLLRQPERSFSRDQLAALLWPAKPVTAARRNLRQAIYNLKTALAGCDPLAVAGGRVSLHPDLDCWCDASAFEHTAGRGGAADPHYLAEAAGLYRGDFLSGLELAGCPEFERWAGGERARLRELAIDVLRNLIESYLARGEFRLGTRYAQRLVDLDRRSEAAHRYLIQLYAFSGRRGRAVERYDELRRLLADELGVEPTEETERVVSVALNEGRQLEPLGEESEPVGPLIPLIGRAATYESLAESWGAVVAGGRRLTLLEGPSGVGKTRLLRTFLDAASVQEGTLVLQGRGEEGGGEPLLEVLRGALGGAREVTDAALDAAPQELLATLAGRLPELVTLRPGLPQPIGRPSLWDAAGRFLDLVAEQLAGPLVLFIDDLHLAGSATVAVLERCLERADSPIWVVATSEPEGEPSLGEELCRRLGPACDRIAVEPLPATAVRDLADALLSGPAPAELVDFLAAADGLPLAIAERINFLWDEGVLVPADGRWQWRGPLPADAAEVASDLDRLIRRRVQRLPSSVRRLAGLAAVVGRRFDAEQLRIIGDEHPAVVEIGLQVLLERWLLRQPSDGWVAGGRERDVEQWMRGAKQGVFEFSHRRIREALFGAIEPERCRELRRQIEAAGYSTTGSGGSRRQNRARGGSAP